MREAVIDIVLTVLFFGGTIQFSKIVEGQKYKKFDGEQLRDLSSQWYLSPSVRKEKIVKTRASYSEDFLKDFGIQVSKELKVVKARILPPPMLTCRDYRSNKISFFPRQGKWDLQNKRMLVGGMVKHWKCVNFSDIRNEQLIAFCSRLVATCRIKGVVLEEYPELPLVRKSYSAIEASLCEVFKQLTNESKNDSKEEKNLLIIILPSQKDSYGEIKRICETQLGVVSQCCNPSKARSCTASYFDSIALKINVKVGGQNFVLEDAINKRIPLVTDHATMIFGVDVTHPSRGDDSSTPSIAAVVASMDWPEVTEYKQVVSAQNPGAEIIVNLQQMVSDLILAFRSKTGHTPHRIIFYRDGVGESQFKKVWQDEIGSIRKACLSLGNAYRPPITFVILQKRHNTRFFAADNVTNEPRILPGTVVDEEVCHPSEFDFFLQSHNVSKGTSRSAHYHVLYDENKFSADDLQTLTHKLCYIYAKCPNSVSIVAPVYYAHLAAFRARCHIMKISRGGSTSRGTLATVKDSIKDTMFYC